MRGDKKQNDGSGALTAAFIAAAAVWLIWALLFPMYRLWHFALPFAFCVLAARAAYGFVLKRRQPKVESEPEASQKKEVEFKATGKPELDAVLLEGRRALSELGRLYAAISKPDVKQRILRLINITDKIIRDAEQDEKDIPQIKKFLNFYMPTTVKLLNEYDRMYASGEEHTSGANIGGAMNRIEAALDRLIEAYVRHYDSLFSNENLDIETDIQVLETLLKREGLAGSDFKIQ